MKIYPINSVVQRTKLSLKNNSQQSIVEQSPKNMSNQTFKGKYIPKSVKQLAAAFAFPCVFLTFPNPATFVISIFGTGGFMLAALANYSDDSDTNK